MKHIIMALSTLIAATLNAQEMSSPKDVVINLFVTTDLNDWSAVEHVFDSSVVLDYSSMNGQPGSELTPMQIIDAWKGILPGFESTHHQLGNFQTSVKDNSAHVFCYGTASHYLKDEAGSLWTVVGTYDFDLVKDRSGKWKITAMKFNFKYQDGNNGLAQKAINNLK